MGEVFELLKFLVGVVIGIGFAVALAFGVVMCIVKLVQRYL